MYIFVNRGLGMSSGKIAAQAAHAAVNAYRNSKSEIIFDWFAGGHYTKLVMQANSEGHLKTIQKYIEDRGFETSLIIDEGLTEIEPHQATALGVEIVDKNDEHTEATFSSFELYRDKIKVTMEIDK